MILDRLLILGLVLVVAVLAVLAFSDDGMLACQRSHSFDVCYASLN